MGKSNLLQKTLFFLGELSQINIIIIIMALTRVLVPLNCVCDALYLNFSLLNGPMSKNVSCLWT